MANKNSCQTLVKSARWCQGKTVKPGIRRRVALISNDQILKFPQISRDDLGRVTSSVMTGSFQLVEDAVWAIIDHLPNKAYFKSETQGEYPSQTFKITTTVVHPGVGDEAADTTASLLNTNCTMLVEDMDGRWRMCGSEDYDSVITSSRDNGQGPTGTAGTTITHECTMDVDAPFYNGPIVTEDGTINMPAGV